MQAGNSSKPYGNIRPVRPCSRVHFGQTEPHGRPAGATDTALHVARVRRGAVVYLVYLVYMVVYMVGIWVHMGAYMGTYGCILRLAHSLTKNREFKAAH